MPTCVSSTWKCARLYFILQELELKQREHAVGEKLRLELAWYEQQKRKLRDKGSDDNYPQFKKTRGLITRLKREQVRARVTRFCAEI